MNLFEQKKKFLEELVCEHYGLDVSDINTSREGKRPEARMIVMVILAKYNKATLQEIANMYNKDHATLIHAKKTYKNLSSTEKEFNQFVSKLEREYLNKFNTEIPSKFMINSVASEVIDFHFKTEIDTISVGRALVCH